MHRLAGEKEEVASGAEESGTSAAAREQGAGCRKKPCVADTVGSASTLRSVAEECVRRRPNMHADGRYQPEVSLCPHPSVDFAEEGRWRNQTRSNDDGGVSGTLAPKTQGSSGHRKDASSTSTRDQQSNLSGRGSNTGIKSVPTGAPVARSCGTQMKDHLGRDEVGTAALRSGYGAPRSGRKADRSEHVERSRAIGEKGGWSRRWGSSPWLVRNDEEGGPSGVRTAWKAYNRGTAGDRFSRPGTGGS